ncbi:butyrophilin subfamily 1 member A1-like [Myripristis murdjan]|uniref:butyrophilin subfamily 1 member A1-like n=1 Tax=Myripristis murdjan TaxID=586833 RepID=UPI001175D3CE|nr:butyrophilin subfamily 1 member A1-like [Myripristis murdjan]
MGPASRAAMIKPALLFGCLFLLSSLSLCEGQSQLIGPSQPIVAIVGGHIFLPSHLEPAVDAVGRTVEWTRPDLDHRFVHVWRRDGVEVVSKKHLSYEGRTSLFLHKLMNGDVSLKLSEVKLSDEGKYQCFIPSLDRESIVELVVGEVSQPEISITAESGSDGETLQCEVCWLPKPEVEWLDDQGKVIKGRDSTLRNPDVNQCYTVTSTVKVQNTDSSRKFTVRIRQPQINKIMKINYHLPAKNTASCTGYMAGIIFLCLSSLAVAVGVGFFVTKKKTKEAERSQTPTPTPATSRRSSSDSAASTENNLLLLDSKKRLKEPAEPESQPRVEGNDRIQNQQLNRQQSVITKAPDSVQHISGNGNASSSPPNSTNRSPHTDGDAKPSLSPRRSRPSFSKSEGWANQSDGPKHGVPVQDSGPPPCSPSHGNSPRHIGSPKRSTPDLSKAAAGSTTSLFNNPLAQKSSFPVRSNSCSLPVRGPNTSLRGKKSPSFRADQNRYSALAEFDQE